MLHNQRHRAISRSKELIFVSLFFAIALAVVDSVFSVYLHGFGLSDSMIGFIAGSLAFLSLFIALFITPVLEKFKQTRVFIVSLLIAVFGYAIIGFVHSLLLFLVVIVLITASGVIRITCLDILFRDNTSNKDLNVNGGLFYRILNIGWISGLLISSVLLLWVRPRSIFLVASFFFAVGLILFVAIHLKNISKKHKKLDVNPLENVSSFVRNSRLLLPYAMVMGIMSWWSLVYLYVPLFMISQGMSSSMIGVFFIATTVPLILFERQVGALSSKRGFRFFFMLGFGGLTLISLVLFFVDSIYLQLVLLSLGSVFVACLEPIQDTFFFKQVAKRDEEKFYPLFGTAGQIGSFAGKFFIAIVLFLLPNSYAYVATAFLMAGYTFLASRIPSDLK